MTHSMAGVPELRYAYTWYCVDAERDRPLSVNVDTDDIDVPFATWHVPDDELMEVALFHDRIKPSIYPGGNACDMSDACRDRNVGAAADPDEGPANTVLADCVAKLTAKVPEDVIGDPATLRNDGTDIATEVTYESEGMSADTNALKDGAPFDPLGAAQTWFAVCEALVNVSVPLVVTGEPETVNSEGDDKPTDVTEPPPPVALRTPPVDKLSPEPMVMADGMPLDVDGLPRSVEAACEASVNVTFPLSAPPPAKPVPAMTCVLVVTPLVMP